MSMKQYYLGIDGGGTKTEAVLCDENGCILFSQKKSATNPNDVGVSCAVEKLRDLIDEAHLFLKKTQNSPAQLCIFGGIAGALNHKDALLAALHEAFPQDLIEINSDAINLLSSELCNGNGCCLICGTGSVCFVRRGTEIMRIGGWGYLLDRSGSGFSMGKEAIEAAALS